MRFLILLIVLVAGGLVLYPLVGEETTTACNALERVSARVLAARDGDHRVGSLLLGQLLQGLSDGQFAALAAKNRYPTLPPGLACTVMYWRAVLDTDHFVKDVSKL